MLIVEDKEYFKEVYDWAEKNRLRDKLDEALVRMHLYGCDWTDPERCRIRLGKDFAPQSFSFVIEFRQEDGGYKLSMNGSLIFHGPHDDFGSGSAPTFAVTIDNTVGWQMHT